MQCDTLPSASVRAQTQGFDSDVACLLPSAPVVPMTGAFQLLDLIVQGLPTRADQVPTWADRASRLLMTPVSANEEVVPPILWQQRVGPRLGAAVVHHPQPVWAQVLAFAWAEALPPSVGALERILLHWWPRVDVRRWPSDWTPGMLAMALDAGLPTLATRMVEIPKSGWSPPPMDAAFQRRHAVAPRLMRALRAARAAPSSGSRSPAWRVAQTCTTVTDLEALAGQDMEVPSAQDAGMPIPWPEHLWPEDRIQDWPQLSVAMGRLRVTHPAAQAQHAAATTWLMARALLRGQITVARQLGWSQARAQGDLTCAEGPTAVPRHLWDVLSRERALARPGQLAFLLDQVFQAAPAGTPGPALRGASSQPALRFWTRALACAWSQPSAAWPTGRRGPGWWRWLMQERPDVWAQNVWAPMARDPAERWQAWLTLALSRGSANALHLLAVTPLRPAQAVVGGAFPWGTLSRDQESAWAKACLFQLVWDRAVNIESPPSALSRWVMWALHRRLRQPGAPREVWVPVLWALLGDWEGGPLGAVHDRTWRWLQRWVEGHLDLARQVNQQEDHVWSMLVAPHTLARWRAMMAVPGPLASGRGRHRS